MSSVEEAADAKTELAGDLAAGVETLSLNQEITFTQYTRVVLPLDGFVFWVKSTLLSTSALLNAMAFNKHTLNDGIEPITAAPSLTVKGSLHYATDVRQEETENYAANRVVFTALAPVNELNSISPAQLWIGEFQGLKFAFSSRGSFYKQADLYHYVGFAVYPDMASQVVNSPAELNTKLVVSNSLPIWLGLNGYESFYGYGNPLLRLYPSFLVDQNIRPPFGSVHIQPEGTDAIGATQLIGRDLSLSQLMVDRVRITMYGMRNDEALRFIACVNQYSLDHDTIGIMNMPALRDEKRTQSELSTIAIKKSVEFQVSYYQAAANVIARKLILSAVPTFIIGE